MLGIDGKYAENSKKRGNNEMNKTKITKLFLLAIVSPSFEAFDVSLLWKFFKQETCLLFQRLAIRKIWPLHLSLYRGFRFISK